MDFLKIKSDYRDEAFKNAFLLIASRGRLLWLMGKWAFCSVNSLRITLWSRSLASGLMLPLEITVLSESQRSRKWKHWVQVVLPYDWQNQKAPKKQTVSSYSCLHRHAPLIQKGHAPYNANFTFTVCFHHYMDYKLAREDPEKHSGFFSICWRLFTSAVNAAWWLELMYVEPLESTAVS